MSSVFLRPERVLRSRSEHLSTNIPAAVRRSVHAVALSPSTLLCSPSLPRPLSPAGCCLLPSPSLPPPASHSCRTASALASSVPTSCSSLTRCLSYVWASTTARLRDGLWLPPCKQRTERSQLTAAALPLVAKGVSSYPKKDKDSKSDANKLADTCVRASVSLTQRGATCSDELIC